jgi:hypothetical protein
LGINLGGRVKIGGIFGGMKFALVFVEKKLILVFKVIRI